MSKKEQAYEQQILDGKLMLTYGVDYSTFDALKTCGLAKQSAHIQGKPIDPYLSTWLVDGDELNVLLTNPSEDEYKALGGKLCSNLVLLGLNAGSMDDLTPAWYFFHHRYKKGTKVITLTASERYLKEYINKCNLPFRGATEINFAKHQARTVVRASRQASISR